MKISPFPIGFKRSLAIVTCALILSSNAPIVQAQEDLRPAASETIHLKVGDIFEVLPVHDIADATYTWILTQDRTFLEANRAPSFRKRLIQPGMYTLYAEIAAPDGSRRISRTITLDYTSRQPGEQADVPTGSGTSVLVRTEPASDDSGRIILTAGRQLIELLPVNPDVVPLALDLDLARDADGDGKTDNDIQSDNTFFHSDATPIFLWITNDPLTTHSASVTAAAPEGARTQKLEILSEETAQEQGVARSPVRIETQQTEGRSYIFTAVFENPDAAAGQLLYQWQFGDGQQSLVTKPTHEYAEDGTYAVSLLIRNLRDGSDVASTSIGLTVSPSEVPQPSSESSSQASEPEPTAPDDTGTSIGSIVLLGGLFLLSILLGVGVIFLIGKLRGGKTSLADKLESMEKTIVTPPATVQVPNLTIAPPQTAAPEKKMQEPPPEIAEREKEQAVEPPAPQPVAKPEVTPSWLAAPTSASAPAAQPAVTQQTTMPTPTATPKPQPAAPVQTPKPNPAAPATPAWLQTPSTPTAPKSPQPVTTPLAAAMRTQPPAQQPQQSVPSAQPKPVAPAASQKPAIPNAPIQNPVQSPTPRPLSSPSTPTPVAQKPQLAPLSKPVTPPVVPFDPTTLPTPKPSVPQSQPAPAATPPAAMPATPQPVTTPASIPSSAAPVTPPPAETTKSPESLQTPAEPAQMDIPLAGDQPIAIIRAESLNPQEGPTSP